MAVKTNATIIHLDVERMKRRGDKPMGGGEKLAELEWLLDAGVHPEHAAAQLGTNTDALMKLARDYGRPEFAKRIAWERTRRDLTSGYTADELTARTA